jgi:hypothetical protein
MALLISLLMRGGGGLKLQGLRVLGEVGNVAAWKKVWEFNAPCCTSTLGNGCDQSHNLRKSQKFRESLSVLLLPKGITARVKIVHDLTKNLEHLSLRFFAVEPFTLEAEFERSPKFQGDGQVLELLIHGNLEGFDQVTVHGIRVHWSWGDRCTSPVTAGWL